MITRASLSADCLGRFSVGWFQSLVELPQCTITTYIVGNFNPKLGGRSVVLDSVSEACNVDLTESQIMIFCIQQDPSKYS